MATITVIIALAMFVGLAQSTGCALDARGCGESAFQRRLKAALKSSGVVDVELDALSRPHAKELNAVLDSVEIQMQSRARQPDSARSDVPAMRTLQRVLDKMQKTGNISRSLMQIMHFDRLDSQTKMVEES